MNLFRKMIKFLDLQKINAQYEHELKEAANRVIDSGWYLMGKELESFEQNYATFCGTHILLRCCQWFRCFTIDF